MRKFIFFYLLYFTVNQQFSQNLNFAEHVGMDHTSALVCINSKSYYLTRSADDCGDKLYLNVSDYNGKPVLKKLLSSTIIRFGHLIKTNDNAILYNIGVSSSHDAGPTSEYLVKIDTNGNQIYSIKLNSVPYDYWDPKPNTSDFIHYQDNTYYLLQFGQLLHYASGGQLLDTIISPGITGRRTICNLSNGNLLIYGSTNSSPNVNFIISANGTLIKQNNCQFPIEKMIESSTHYYGLNVNGIIEKYDTSLVFQGNSSGALSPGSYTITDFVLRNDSVFVTGISGTTKNPFYAILNSNLNVIYQTTSSLQGVMPTGIGLPTNNAVHIVSTCYSASKKEYSFSSLHKLNLSGVLNSNSNIGVIGFSNYNTHLIKTGPLCKPYLEMYATVKNFGTDTVKSFYLNSFADNMGGIQYCLYLLHKYQQVSLPPDGTLSVPTGSFYSQFFFSDTSKYESKNINVCVFTSIPNNSNDTDINNDAYCENILMTTTGIEKNEWRMIETKIFPNPFQDSFSIYSNENIKRYILYSSLGEIIKEETVSGKEFMIESENLSSGIYYIRIEGEKGSSVKKLIKND